MTDDASVEAAGSPAGGAIPLVPAVAAAQPTAFPCAPRKVPPPTPGERAARATAMAQALKAGAAPYRDAEGKARYVFFKDANTAPVEAWQREPGAGRGFRLTQQVRKAAGQLIGHPEDRIELAKRLGAIFYEEGRSVERAAERGLYDAIWRYEEVWDSFTVPRHHGLDRIETGRIAAVAEEEARRLRAEDPAAQDGFWVRDRKNAGLIYVVPNRNPAESNGATAVSPGDLVEAEHDATARGDDEAKDRSQANAELEPIQAEMEPKQSVPKASIAPEGKTRPTLNYTNVPLPALESTWELTKGTGKGTADPTVVNLSEERIRNILENKPGIFEIEESPAAVGQVPDYEQEHLGYWSVWVHQEVVERESKQEGVDPDLLKALMYFENARGASYGHIFEFLGASDSLLPMNIKESVWSGLLGEGVDLSDPVMNIRAAARLVRRIQERIVSPSVAKIGSIWNFAGRESVSNNGARVADIYGTRAWEQRPVEFSEEMLGKKPTRRPIMEEYQRQRDALRARLQAD